MAKITITVEDVEGGLISIEAKQEGDEKPKKRKLILVAESEYDGERFEFIGKRMIEKQGFRYTRAYYACKIEGKYAGFKWHFKER